MTRLIKLFRLKCFAGWRALNPLFVVARRNIGGNELLGGASVGLIGVGLGLIWFPLAPICFGAAGLTIAVINARMR